jgi:hypothetical protein
VRAATGPEAFVVAFERGIVHDHGHAVGRQVHVELETVRPAPQASSKAASVFSGRERRAAAMREHAAPAALEESHRAQYRIHGMPNPSAISTLGDLRRAVERGEIRHRSVHEEVRDNLIEKLRAGGALFPGIVGYDETVCRSSSTRCLSRHHFILLGLRGRRRRACCARWSRCSTT